MHNQETIALDIAVMVLTLIIWLLGAGTITVLVRRRLGRPAGSFAWLDPQYATNGLPFYQWGVPVSGWYMLSWVAVPVLVFGCIVPTALVPKGGSYGILGLVGLVSFIPALTAIGSLIEDFITRAPSPSGVGYLTRIWVAQAGDDLWFCYVVRSSFGWSKFDGALRYAEVNDFDVMGESQWAGTEVSKGWIERSVFLVDPAVGDPVALFWLRYAGEGRAAMLDNLRSTFIVPKRELLAAAKKAASPVSDDDYD